jgi:hypothetical protein
MQGSKNCEEKPTRADKPFFSCVSGWRGSRTFSSLHCRSFQKQPKGWCVLGRTGQIEPQNNLEISLLGVLESVVPRKFLTIIVLGVGRLNYSYRGLAGRDWPRALTKDQPIPSQRLPDIYLRYCQGPARWRYVWTIRLGVCHDQTTMKGWGAQWGH